MPFGSLFLCTAISAMRLSRLPVKLVSVPSGLLGSIQAWYCPPSTRLSCSSCFSTINTRPRLQVTCICTPMRRVLMRFWSSVRLVRGIISPEVPAELRQDFGVVFYFFKFHAFHTWFASLFLAAYARSRAFWSMHSLSLKPFKMRMHSLVFFPIEQALQILSVSSTKLYGCIFVPNLFLSHVGECACFHVAAVGVEFFSCFDYAGYFFFGYWFLVW